MTEDAPATALPSCRALLAGEDFLGKRAPACSPAISAQSVGARGIHVQMMTITPGARARAHKHKAHETASTC